MSPVGHPEYSPAAHVRRSRRAAPLAREAKRVVFLVILCQFVHGLTFMAVPLLLPLVREDFGIDFTQAGMLSAVATFSYALGQVPAGFLADRFGPTRLVFIGVMGWSAFAVAFGLIHDFHVALASQFAAGIFRSLLFAPGLALLTGGFPRERRATAISLYMLGGFAGNVVLSLGAPMLTAAFGWRMALMLLAVPGIALGLAYKSARDCPRGGHSERVRLAEAVTLVRSPVLWLCSGLQIVRFSVVTAFHVWLPSLLMIDRGFSVKAAGAVVALSAACTALANTLGGYVCDRLRNPPLVIGGSLSILCIASVLLVKVVDARVLVAVIVLNAIFVQFYFGALFVVPVEAFGARLAGSVSGFGNLFANLGGVVTALALGMLKDATGDFRAGFYAIAVVCTIGVGIALLLARVRPVHPAESRP